MTTLEYMTKQLQKHRANYERESKRGAKDEMLQNISEKIRHYAVAVDALLEREGRYG